MHHARVQYKMFVESRLIQPISGQDKPFIAERFAPQTVQRYLFNKQIDNRNPEGLKGFSGKKNAYREGDICLVFCVNNKIFCSLAPSRAGVRNPWRAETLSQGIGFGWREGVRGKKIPEKAVFGYFFGYIICNYLIFNVVLRRERLSNLCFQEIS